MGGGRGGSDWRWVAGLIEKKVNSAEAEAGTRISLTTLSRDVNESESGGFSNDIIPFYWFLALILGL